VVDLGAAPGGWLQAVRKIVGDTGFVLGVDLKPIDVFYESNIRTIISDIREQKTTEIIREFLSRNADVVVSDVAPEISGIWELDHANQIDLASHSLRIAMGVLQPHGHFFVKAFEGCLLNDFVKKVRRRFDFVKRVKPRASRPESAEIYVLGMNLKQRI
jgi:23S rRNA (uridine2552-2'-O)-methyltransferase